MQKVFTKFSAVLTLLILAGPLAAAVLRGPYLQGGGPDRMIVQWRTDAASVGKVCYGTQEGALKDCVSETVMGADHAVLIQGLKPSTRYYYSFDGQPGADQFFVTSPLPGTVKDTRIWVLGDAGTGDDNPKRVQRSWLDYSRDHRADLVLQMGDNAYYTGTDAQYQKEFFQIFTGMLKNNVFWSCMGNHETYNGEKIFPYFNIFSFPTQGELGGVASGTERYYSFDYGQIHFIALDANDEKDRKPQSPMLTWLEKDLALNKQPWTVAFWHQGPYTKGSHDSDLEVEPIEMRTNVNPILEAAGVDLVLNGHSHVYERSYLLDGHYGLTTTFNRQQHIRDAGDKKFDGADLYAKPLGQKPHAGTAYVVIGCSAKADGGPLNHPAMKKSIGDTYGSLVIDVQGTVLKCAFLADNGQIRDSFVIAKGPLPTPTLTPTVTPYAGTPTNTPTSTASPTQTPTPAPTETPGPLYVINSFGNDDLNGDDKNDHRFDMGEGSSAKSIAYVQGAMNLEYYVTGGNNYTWWYSALSCLHAERYGVLEMRVKGQDGGEKFDVTLESTGADCKGKDRASVHIEDYGPLTKDWRTISIPLRDFKKLKSRILGSILLAEFRAGSAIQIDDIQLKDKK
jgi:hypothetical protein